MLSDSQPMSGRRAEPLRCVHHSVVRALHNLDAAMTESTWVSVWHVKNSANRHDRLAIDSIGLDSAALSLLRVYWIISVRVDET